MEGIKLYKEYIQQCEVATGNIDSMVSQWQTELSSKLTIYKLKCSFDHLFNSNLNFATSLYVQERVK